LPGGLVSLLALLWLLLRPAPAKLGKPEVSAVIEFLAALTAPPVTWISLGVDTSDGPKLSPAREVFKFWPTWKLAVAISLAFLDVYLVVIGGGYLLLAYVMGLSGFRALGNLITPSPWLKLLLVAAEPFGLPNGSAWKLKAAGVLFE